MEQDRSLRVGGEAPVLRQLREARRVRPGSHWGPQSLPGGPRHPNNFHIYTKPHMPL